MFTRCGGIPRGMNTETLKKEFKRLTDVAELKKELNRLASEIRQFDFTTAIPASQRSRVEKRYRELRATLAQLQQRLDSSFSKVSSLLRRQKATAKKSSKKKAPTRKKAAAKAGQKTGQKTGPKRASKKA